MGSMFNSLVATNFQKTSGSQFQNHNMVSGLGMEALGYGCKVPRLRLNGFELYVFDKEFLASQKEVANWDNRNFPL